MLRIASKLLPFPKFLRLFVLEVTGAASFGMVCLIELLAF